ncbi:Protein FAM76A [Lamellibrachia satsuma]|nr:Protein FAM76A [Lamellibrachia satsuma]
MAALFACTKCHSRHLFEELSEGDQICKECRNNFPVVKCTYCRAEFQHEEKNSTCSICRKCEQFVRSYGKPSSCEYCSVLAAFIGNRCQMCANSEKKWGPPVTCDQCKQQCAFDRSEESRKKVDGKLLCWLCTMAYRRAKSKARKSRLDYQQSTPQSTISTSSEHLATPKQQQQQLQQQKNKQHHSKQQHSKQQQHHSKQHHSNGGERNKPGSGAQQNGSGKDDRQRHRHLHHHRFSRREKTPQQTALKHKAETTDARSKEDQSPVSTPVTATPTKKPKWDKSTSNGLVQTKSMPESTSSFGDFVSSDNLVVVTQLKEEVTSLKRQLQAKEQQILERDKKMTELKAKNFEMEKEMRLRVQMMQKQQGDTIMSLKEQNRALQKQVAILNKSSRKVQSGT